MQKLIYIIFAIVLLSSCKKSDQLEIPISKEISMSTDPDFIYLMDAMKRFDPLYVDIIFNNKYDYKIANYKNLVSNVNEQTSEEVFISNLISQYHFKNKEELLHYSTIIQDGLTKLFNTYLASLTTKEQAILYFKARKLYAKNKLSKNFGVSNLQATKPMYFDMPIAEDDYYRVIAEEQEVDDFSGNNHANDCADVCCINKKICVNNAYMKFLENTKLIAASAVGGGGIAFKIGSILGGPQIGIATGVIGGVYSAAATTAVIYLIYITDKENCALTFKSCMLGK